MAWDDHSTAWRAGVYACAVYVLGRPAWLRAALTRHGSALADPGFYVVVGNHALNQDIGLLDVGLTLQRTDWIDLAVARLGRVIVTDVDPQGVNKEGAIFYQQYIYGRARVAEGRIHDAGKAIPATFARVDRMPAFLALAILPDGTYEALGDTDPTKASVIPGTVAEYAATSGASGPRPATTFAQYGQGFAFGRTGWGETRPLIDEIAYTVRYGPAPSSSHQHEDGGALTVYGFGTRLLVDPGRFTYQRDAWRAFFISRAAHNVLTVTGVASRRSYPTSLASSIERDHAAVPPAHVHVSGHEARPDRGLVAGRSGTSSSTIARCRQGAGPSSSAGTSRRAHRRPPRPPRSGHGARGATCSFTSWRVARCAWSAGPRRPSRAGSRRG